MSVAGGVDEQIEAAAATIPSILRRSGGSPYRVMKAGIRRIGAASGATGPPSSTLSRRPWRAWRRGRPEAERPKFVPPAATGVPRARPGRRGVASGAPPRVDGAWVPQSASGRDHRRASAETSVRSSRRRNSKQGRCSESTNAASPPDYWARGGMASVWMLIGSDSHRSSEASVPSSVPVTTLTRAAGRNVPVRPVKIDQNSFPIDSRRGGTGRQRHIAKVLPQADLKGAPA